MRLLEFFGRAPAGRHVVAVSESYVISTATLVTVLELEQRQDLTPLAKRRLLSQVERGFEAAGWVVERLGHEGVRATEQATLRQLAEILDDGGDYAQDLVRRIRAVHEYRALRQQLGTLRAQAYRPWPLETLSGL